MALPSTPPGEGTFLSWGWVQGGEVGDGHKDDHYRKNSELDRRVTRVGHGRCDESERRKRSGVCEVILQSPTVTHPPPHHKERGWDWVPGVDQRTSYSRRSSVGLPGGSKLEETEMRSSRENRGSIQSHWSSVGETEMGTKTRDSRLGSREEKVGLHGMRSGPTRCTFLV